MSTKENLAGVNGILKHMVVISQDLVSDVLRNLVERVETSDMHDQV